MDSWYRQAANKPMADIFYLLGAATSLYLVWQLALHLLTFLRSSDLPRYLHEGKESWALVTGSSDGIGLGFAQELCKNGFNVILHGRRREKLLDVKARLNVEFPSVKIRILVIDALEPITSLDDLVSELADIHLTVLVNNVGGQPNHIAPVYQSFRDFTSVQVDQLINLNARFAVQLTRVLLPILERNGPSLIMNISSVATVGMPYLSIYVGTKGLINTFTKALNSEMRAEGKNVEVIGILGGKIVSASNNVQTNFFTPTSREMARAARPESAAGEL